VVDFDQQTPATDHASPAFLSELAVNSQPKEPAYDEVSLDLARCYPTILSKEPEKE
jgi:hypothetical protein